MADPDPKLAALAAAGLMLRQVVKLFSWTQDDFPPCNAKIVRADRGLPLAKQVVVHTTKDGWVTVKPLVPDPPGQERLFEVGEPEKKKRKQKGKD